jgi:Protein of unknown function (DUF998)
MRLREALVELRQPGARSRLVTAVGTSCSGKIRTIYEAVNQVLPDWTLVKPAHIDDLTRMLYAGIPKHTVGWLDELQDFLDPRASSNGPPIGQVSYMLKRVLLICGILAPLIYIGSDIVACMSWEGYSFLSQAVSELRGIGAQTREFLIPVLTIYAVLEILFGIGIWMVARQKRALRVTGALFIGLGALDLSGRFFAMNANEPIVQ